MVMEAIHASLPIESQGLPGDILDSQTLNRKDASKEKSAALIKPIQQSAVPEGTSADPPSAPVQNGMTYFDAHFPRVPQGSLTADSSDFQRTHAMNQQLGHTVSQHEAVTSSNTQVTDFAITPVATPNVHFKTESTRAPDDRLRENGRGSLDIGEREIANKDRRGQSFFTKVKALTGAPPSSSHRRTSSSGTNEKDQARSSNNETTPTRRHPRQTDGNDAGRDVGDQSDADAEDSGTERTGDANSKKKSKYRRKDRFHRSVGDSLPTSPTKGHASDQSRQTPPASPLYRLGGRVRPLPGPRSITMPSMQEDVRQGVSEDEGRQRINRTGTWRMPSSWSPNPKTGNNIGGRRHVTRNDQVVRRPEHARRTNTTGDLSEIGAAPGATSWRLHRGERASTVSAAKWRQLKAGLKTLAQRKKAEITIDHAKSAELLAELTAITPAALILASVFRSDDHGHKRVPILLEQLKVTVTETKQYEPKSSERHLDFRIEMEYGNGSTRMKWSVYRNLREFVGLHTRYKFHSAGQKYIPFKPDDTRSKLPHFPRSAFPYLRGMRDLGSDDEEEAEETDLEGAHMSSGEGTLNETNSKNRRKARPTLKHRRKTSTANIQDNENNMFRKGAYAERQRKKLAIYLTSMCRYLMLRPDSNRLCQFLELSALGVRLAAENSYHGKEGALTIQTANGLDFRRALTPTLIVGRHRPKWFCVRHSYIVCVDSIEGMNIYDVFLVDSSFHISTKRKRLRDQQKAKEIAKAAKQSAAHPQHHILKIHNAERKLKLLAKNERTFEQFQESISFMVANSPWSRPQRFGSFAPVRTNVSAQWLVDGRDYMWNASRAISMAKDVIYIHDWWLSPELYMRRPAAISQKWRLDRLLQRKAREGVKIFVIMYRNINSAIPIDSEYSKFSLLDLHPNIFVQRSPNQFRQNTFFWAHHEKLCLIDHMVAFIGGIDLCFGRWDTPQHLVVDDKLTGFESSSEPKDADHCQLWPGKDYSNPRVQDFCALDKPYEEMYNRAEVPRMPWHDIHMQIVGQPARDLTRHFVQRWNYILRQRKPTRPTPFLLPPPDLNPGDVSSLGLDGTCEIQVLRSSCEWSLGTPGVIEHSIMNAYVKLIETSDHFVYIENQFFISSCEVEGTTIVNKIGDALVERIIRAAHNQEDWRAIILIPLMPGFQNTVDQPDGTSIRLIMQCQFRSICRGEASIFGRLRDAGIEPEDYIQFFSLRAWGRIGPNKKLVTEQLYIHAKCMIVDDRVAIIGSANINERSLLGDRDSECAAVVRDTNMIESTMNGVPYLVGRFAHTLRMRLMREHLGLDVDQILEDDVKEAQQADLDAANQKQNSTDDGIEEASATGSFEEAAKASKAELEHELVFRSDQVASFNHDVDWEQGSNPNLKSNRRVTEDARVTNNADHRKSVEGEGHDAMKLAVEEGYADARDTILTKTRSGQREVLVKQNLALDSTQSDITGPRSDSLCGPMPNVSAESSDSAGAKTQDQAGAPLRTTNSATKEATNDSSLGEAIKSRNSIHSPLLQQQVKARPFVDKDCMRDPVADEFYLNIWSQVAENNTKLYREVFRCMPDNEVKSWKDYKEYVAYSERFEQAHGNSEGTSNKKGVLHPTNHGSGPPGAEITTEKMHSLAARNGLVGNHTEPGNSLTEKILQKLTHEEKESILDVPDVTNWAKEANQAQAQAEAEQTAEHNDEQTPDTSSRISPDPTTSSMPEPGITKTTTSQSSATNASASQRRPRRGTLRNSKREFRASDDIMSKQEAEELLDSVQGPLVMWPYDWLAKEEQGGNWGYSIDGLAPLEIYN